jgi:uncharacterized membrane protein YoaK (UPF0700 family)
MKGRTGPILSRHEEKSDVSEFGATQTVILRGFTDAVGFIGTSGIFVSFFAADTTHAGGALVS